VTARLLSEARERARREGRFADADGIRERRTDAGVEVNDPPAGTEWSV
jgi:cysteinyl-tRNA synthetase